MENKNTDTTDRELKISRLLNAPVALVWEVFTKPEHLKNWWGPDGFTNTITTMDVKAGGDWYLVMHGPDGTDYENKSIYREIVKDKKIVFEHFAPHFIATIEFESQGNQTFLSWRMLFDSKEALIEVVKEYHADEGMVQNIEKLNEYLLATEASQKAS